MNNGRNAEMKKKRTETKTDMGYCEGQKKRVMEG